MEAISDKLIKDYALGKCNARQLETIARYVAEHPEDAQLFYLAKDAYLQGLPNKYDDEAEVSRAEARLFESIEAEEGAEHTQHKARMVSLMRYAAIALVVVFLGALAFFGLDDPKAGMLVVATADKAQEVTLPDGTHVWLNEQSQLSYPATFDNDERQVELDGEALFEVTKNPRKPFVVTSGAMSTRVLGTVFNMNARKGAARQEVSLLEGKVEVKDLATQSTVELQPNEKAMLDVASHKMLVQKAYAAIDAMWHDGMIPFDKMNVRQITGILEEIYNVKIHLTGFAASQTYSGAVKYDSNIDSVLQSLSVVIPIVVTHRGNGIIELVHK